MADIACPIVAMSRSLRCPDVVMVKFAKDEGGREKKSLLCEVWVGAAGCVWMGGWVWIGVWVWVWVWVWVGEVRGCGCG